MRPFRGRSWSFTGPIIFHETRGTVVRVKVTLACTECKQRDYDTMRNKKNDPDRFGVNKYCRFRKKHIVHKGTK